MGNELRFSLVRVGELLGLSARVNGYAEGVPAQVDANEPRVHGSLPEVSSLARLALVLRTFWP